MLNGQEVLQKITANILLTLSVFQSLSYLYFQIIMYIDSSVAISRERSTTPTIDDDSYFSEDIDGRGNIPSNNKCRSSQPIEKNNKKKKYNKKKRSLQLSLIGAGMGKVDKASLLCSKITFFKDEIYGKKIPKKYKSQLFLYMVTKYNSYIKSFTAKYQNIMIKLYCVD